jgi:protocatechuate 3,4-dioxygenase beta subunit
MKKSHSESRRLFIKRASLLAVAVPFVPLGARLWRGDLDRSKDQKNSSLKKESFGVSGAPANLSWKTKVVSDDEPGEPLVISGRVLDAKTLKPLEGITLYVYHTDRTGHYTQDGEDNPHRPRLRGWMRTEADGRYEFQTIKPGPYPRRNTPTHIHISYAGPHRPEDWLDDYWFTGDPRINTETMKLIAGRGGDSPIITLQRDAHGILRGVRDIKL